MTVVLFHSYPVCLVGFFYVIYTCSAFIIWFDVLCLLFVVLLDFCKGSVGKSGKQINIIIIIINVDHRRTESYNIVRRTRSSVIVTHNFLFLSPHDYGLLQYLSQSVRSTHQ